MLFNPLSLTHTISQRVVPSKALARISRSSLSQSYTCSTRRSSTTAATASQPHGACKNLQTINDYTSLYPSSVFVSTSISPYQNLAIENYILRKSDPTSKILFLYTNWPCVVIGRNQNPWLECNIARLQQGLVWDSYQWRFTNSREIPAVGKENDGEKIPLDLVRRRSGGGTVIHDAGNLNFSFIVPNDKDFTRDKHAELVVSVLEDLKVARSVHQGKTCYDSVRVNERHDIVMTPHPEYAKDGTTKEFKVSGSAYKLTRGRALHHGTILHSSPNVGRSDNTGTHSTSFFSSLLTSPAKTYLEAKGVGSVRSPVHNLFDVQSPSLRNELRSALVSRIAVKFYEVYGGDLLNFVGPDDCRLDTNEDIYKDAQDLMTDDWRFCQTPTFDYKSVHDNGNLEISFQVSRGTIRTSCLRIAGESGTQAADLFAQLDNTKLHEIQDWGRYISLGTGALNNQVWSHLQQVFPRINQHEPGSSASNVDDIVRQTKIQNVRGDDIVAVVRQSSKGSVEVENQQGNTIVER